MNSLTRAREGLAFHGHFYGLKTFCCKNRAILRNAVRINLALVSSKKHAAQHPEKLRKNSFLN
jgi:hypothetical protein